MIAPSIHSYCNNWKQNLLLILVEVLRSKQIFIMRHSKKFNHLKRKSGHRKALLRNLAIALIEHKRITTTLAKAKALRVFVEPLITKSLKNTMHTRRVVFSYLQNKEAVKELFGPIAVKIGDRPGGYIRIIKMGARISDAAEMAMIEFVDFNDVYSKEDGDGSASSKKRRRRRGGGSKKAIAEESTTALTETEEDIAVEDQAAEEEVIEDSSIEPTAETEQDAVAEHSTEKADDENESKDENAEQ